MVSSLKRKIRSGLNHTTKSRKKTKTVFGSLATVDALPWKTLSHTGGFENTDDGILELEEVDNIQVVYEETPEGKVAIFRVRCPRYGLALTLSDVQILDAPQIPASSRPSEDDKTADVSDMPDMSDEDMEECTPPNNPTRGLLPEWDIFELHDQLLRALHHRSFMKPTPIQSKALLPALRGKDVVGVAETVCTFPYLLPSNT